MNSKLSTKFALKNLKANRKYSIYFVNEYYGGDFVHNDIFIR